jgi:hypothetical protein
MITTKELLRWLKRQQRSAEQHRDEKAKNREFGDAQLAEGIAQAYAFTILHVRGKK